MQEFPFTLQKSKSSLREAFEDYKVFFWTFQEICEEIKEFKENLKRVV